MNELLLPLGIWMRLTMRDLGERLQRAWADRAEEDGVDEAVSKMIWLAVGVGVAVVATTFFLGVFNTAKDGVPDPVAPTP
jgi:hypothetical protein